MSDETARSHGDRFSVRMSADSHFSWLRTRFSVERTLMSWVRTAVSLIGFGFTIVQFFDRLGAMEGVREAARPQAPRYLGLALIAAGIMSLVIAVWQYHRVLAYLRSGQLGSLGGIDDHSIQTPLYAISLALILIGIFAFASVLTRSF
ncbi:YidH family protein [Enterovirga rhinocerotis]|uniref:Putative membrane protein n=1 Tax=Enterovirga rhinocerotis TaxID=1339210 RepID=A0A4V3DWL8_9HYPH|nr:DUF202 domain-containing protein [Enterovirga rhinocerotis]TDR85339.1 putative membrane protein [Enterovirga rhinocerotis]